MAVTTTKTNKPINPRGNDQSPKGYNRAALYSGKALDFDGVNDVVTISDNAAVDFGTSDFSIAFIMQSDTVGYGRLIDKRSGTSGYTLSVGTSKELVLELNNGAGSAGFFTSSVYADGKLKHVVVSADRDGNASFYINGVLDETIDISSKAGNLDSTSDLFIGADAPSGVGLYYNGSIAGVKMYSTALTAAQVADLYNNPEKIVPTGVSNDALKLWLPMMEGAGTTAYDGSGNGNHGTISGATYVNGVGAPVAQSAVMDWNKGTNILQQSNAFSTSPWLSFVTLTSGQAGHDGTNNAWKIEKDASSEYLYQNTSIPAAGVFSIYAKAGTLNWVRLLVNGSSNGFYYFDLENGVVGSGSAAIAGYIDDVGNGWYRCSLSFNLPTVSRVRIYPADGDNDISGTSGNIYIQDAQAINGSSVGPYIPTLSTAQTSDVLLPQGLTTGRDITGVNLFENVRKQGALNLDGNSWAEVHDNASVDLGSGQLSLESWVRVDELGVYQVILEKGQAGIGSNRGFMLRVRSNNLIQITITGDNEKQITSNAIVQGDWTHLCVTKDDLYFNLYIDGVYITQATNPTGSIDNAESLLIGKDKTNGWQVNGSIAQPRIYNRALTAEEVERNYNAGKNIYK